MFNKQNQDRNERIQALKEVVSDENLVIATPESGGSDHHSKIDKNRFLQKLDNVKMTQEIQQMLDYCSFEERYEWMHINKLRGNKLFRENKFEKAIEVYSQCLMGVYNQFENKEQQQRFDQELKIPIMNNLTQCLLKQKKFTNCVSLCDKVIELDQFNIKAHLLKAQAYGNGRMFDEAFLEIDKIQMLCQQKNDLSSLKEIQAYHKKLKIEQNKESKAYSNYFSKNSDEEEYEENRNMKNGQKNAKGGLVEIENKNILNYVDENEQNQSQIMKIIYYPISKIKQVGNLLTNLCKRDQTNSDDELQLSDDEQK